MDSREAKILLQACRVGSGDEDAAIFQDAFAQVAKDPELASWFRAEQEFDAVMIRKFGEVQVDGEMKERILRALAPATAGDGLEQS